MKVLAIVGSPTGTEGYTYRSVQALEQSLMRMTDVSFRYHFLGDSPLALCRGKLSCVRDGENTCPFRADIAPIERAMHEADVVVFASPVHCFNTSSLMKNLFDLFVYQMHRPDFFDRRAVVVTTAAGAGQKGVLNFLEKTVANWGFWVVGRLGTHAGLFDEPKYQARLSEAADRLAGDLVATTGRSRPAPGVADLINFRVWRSVIKRTRNASPYDWAQWQDRGWLARSYYLPGRVNPISNLLAAVVERLIGASIENVWVKPVV